MHEKPAIYDAREESAPGQPRAGGEGRRDQQGDQEGVRLWGSPEALQEAEQQAQGVYEPEQADGFYGAGGYG